MYAVYSSAIMLSLILQQLSLFILNWIVSNRGSYECHWVIMSQVSICCHNQKVLPLSLLNAFQVHLWTPGPLRIFEEIQKSMKSLVNTTVTGNYPEICMNQDGKCLRGPKSFECFKKLTHTYNSWRMDKLCFVTSLDPEYCPMRSQDLQLAM